MSRIKSEDVILLFGGLLLIYEIKVKGFEWVTDTLIMLFISITIFAWLKQKIKRVLNNGGDEDDDFD